MSERFFFKHLDGIRNGLASARLPIVLACVAMVLVAGSVGTGLQFDDYIHQRKLLSQVYTIRRNYTEIAQAEKNSDLDHLLNYTSEDARLLAWLA